MNTNSIVSERPKWVTLSARKIEQLRKIQRNNIGRHRSEEAKRKIREARARQVFSEEHKRKISNSLKGHTVSYETRMKISKSNKGRPVKHSEETKRKISETEKGRVSPMRGRHHSEETKKRISESNKGRFVSEEHKRRIGEANKGHRMTEEQKIKLREARSKQKFPLKDTEPELYVRDKLLKRGIPFRTNRYVDGLLTDTPYKFHQFDIIIDEIKTIIEIQGCYWHGCSICFPNPTEKQKRWIEKDLKIKEIIENKNWKMIWIWEHNIKNNKIELIIKGGQLYVDG